MRRLLLFFSFLFFGLNPLAAQEYDVTFNVDMSCAGVSFTDVYVTGPWAGWCGDCHLLTDTDGDDIYTITLPFMAGTFEYKFEVDNWTFQEDLVDDMVGGATCAPVTDFYAYANRTIEVVDVNLETNDTYGSCDPCPSTGTEDCEGVVGGTALPGSACDDENPDTMNDVYGEDCVCAGSQMFDVNFSVDMACAGVDFTTVYVTGPWAGWCGDCYPLSDMDGDGIWTATYPFNTGTVEYKYEVDNWTFQEDLVDDMVAGGTCAPVTDYYAYANRTVDVVDASVDTDDVYGRCDPCPDVDCEGVENGSAVPGTACDDGDINTILDVYGEDCVCSGTVYLDIVFAVDMNCVTTSFTTVYATGPWINWCGDCVPLSDDDGDGIWRGSYTLPAGTIEYKYELDNWASQEDLVDDMVNGADCAPVTDFYAFANRTAELVDQFVYTNDTYGSCEPCSLPVDCEGVEGGSVLPGTACDDGDDTTTNDVYNNDCVCAGTAPSADVTFTVDMSCSEETFTTVYVTGPWADWCGDCYPLSDNGDGTWSTTLSFPEGTTVEYKYELDNWTTQEDLVDDMVAGASCAPVTDFYAFANRTIEAAAGGASSSDTYGSCEPCGGAANVDVTFTVDMSCAGVDFTTPFITGPWADWCGDCYPLTDNGDGTWSTTLPFPEGTTVEYKYEVDNWTFQEDLVDDMVAGGTCAPVTDFYAFANRTIDATDGAASADTYGSCDACPDVVTDCEGVEGGSALPGTACDDGDDTTTNDMYDADCVCAGTAPTVDVTFTVDMSCSGETFTTPFITGPWADWCGDCYPLTDNGDGSWSTTISFPEGTTVEYKYELDNWTTQEDLVDDMVAGATCAPVTDFYAFANRTIVAAEGAASADTYGSCEPCGGAADVDVTFTVDMSCAGVAFTTPYITGPWADWCGDCHPLTDNGDGTWSITLPFPEGTTIEYKYEVDNWTFQEDLVDDMVAGGTCAPVTDFYAFANRTLVAVDGATSSDTYGSCDACPDVVVDCEGVEGGPALVGTACDDGDDTTTNDVYGSDCVCAGTPPSVDVNFTVDMSCSGETFTTVFVTGPWANWCGDCYPLTDNGDGTWSATISFPEGTTVEYKYELDNWTTQEDLVDDMVAGADCAPVTDFYSYANRTIVAADGAASSDTYGSCDACPDVVVDCEGVEGGSALPGTACDDNDADTENDVYGTDCTCAGTTIQQADCEGVAGGSALPGTACDDNDATTENDVYGTDCTCAGTTIQQADCEGVTGGSALPGTACDDNDATTENDVYGTDCTCAGTPIYVCPTLDGNQSLSTNAVCSGGSVSLNNGGISGDATGASISWVYAGGEAFDGTLPTVEGCAPATYAVKAVLSVDGQDCSDESAEMIIMVYPAVTVSISEEGACNVSVDACSDYTVTFQTDSGTSGEGTSYAAGLGTAGTVTFTVTNPAGLEGCNTATATGSFNCIDPCTLNNAGVCTLSLYDEGGRSSGAGPNDVCEGQGVQATVANAVVEDGYIGGYIMYLDPANPVGSQVASNADGLFINDGSLPQNQTLYVAYLITGPDDCSIIGDPDTAMFITCTSTPLEACDVSEVIENTDTYNFNVLDESCATNNGDPISLVSVNGNTNSPFTTAEGEWTFDAAGNITFDPAEGFFGTVTVDYVITDGQQDANGSLTIVVEGLPPIKLVLECAVQYNKSEETFTVHLRAGLGDGTYTVTTSAGGDPVTITEGEITSIGDFDFATYTGTEFEVTITDASGNTGSCSSLIQATLAVDLVDFYGEAQATGNLLNWVTASEENNDFFTLYRSYDGENFEAIATIDGENNTSLTNYSHLDKEVTGQTAYYMLQQTDFDGTTTNSNVITIHRETAPNGLILVSPIPATDIVNVEFVADQANEININVYDITGKLIDTKIATTTSGYNNITLDVSHYNVGVYFLSITDGNEVYTSRIIKD